MCGIAGILDASTPPDTRTLQAMNDAQAHRGPDGEGIWSEGPIGLAHRRLAVLDPHAGQQPMQSASGDTVVIFNGEIYNFENHKRDLRERGVNFSTRTDTETLLYFYEQEPDQPEKWLSQLNGIFSFAIWDRKRSRLLLARDPVGVKPLHLACIGDRLLFASEIKSLLAAGFPARLNDRALHAFMNLRFVPGEHTLFRDVHRLPPGHYLFAEPGKSGRPQAYSRLPDDVDDRGNTAAYTGDVRDYFSQAVERQLLADVPIGMSLSGGLDSSMIVHAAAQAFESDRDFRTTDRTLRTFTLGFNEPTDENEDARFISEHLGTTHYDMTLDSGPLTQQSTVIRAVEEPKINMHQGYALAGFARPQVPVLLGGLGGDELFAGYDLHRFCNTLGRFHRAGSLFRWGSKPASNLLWHLQSGCGMLKTEHYRIGAQIALSVGNKAEFYTRLRNGWDNDNGMYKRLYLNPDRFRDLPKVASYFQEDFEDDRPFLDQILRCEFQNKLVNDFLINEDRVTSAHGMEGRLPFLDHDLVNFAFRIPARYKMSGSETRTMWKAAVAQALPERVLKKKKHGFSFSSAHQWDKDLRETVKRELTEDWCRDTGLFHPGFVQSLLHHPTSSNLRWHYFVAWMMLGVKEWIQVFDVQTD